MKISDKLLKIAKELQAKDGWEDFDTRNQQVRTVMEEDGWGNIKIKANAVRMTVLAMRQLPPAVISKSYGTLLIRFAKEFDSTIRKLEKIKSAPKKVIGSTVLDKEDWRVQASVVLKY